MWGAELVKRKYLALTLLPLYSSTFPPGQVYPSRVTQPRTIYVPKLGLRIKERNNTYIEILIYALGILLWESKFIQMGHLSVAMVQGALDKEFSKMNARNNTR